MTGFRIPAEAQRANAFRTPESAMQSETPTTPEQQQRLGNREVSRQVAQTADPFGTGFVTQPIARALTDPDQQAGLVRAAQGVGDFIQQIPGINPQELGRDIVQKTREGVARLPETAGNVLMHLPQILYNMTLGASNANREAQRDLDVAQVTGNGERAREAADRANATAAENAINAAGALIPWARLRPLEAAGIAGGISTPFALSRGEGSAEERIARAVPEIAGSSAFAGGTQALFNALPKAATISPQSNAAVQALDDAGLPLTWAAVRGKEAAPATMAIAESPIGGNVRANMQNAVDTARDRADTVARSYGSPAVPESAGDLVQTGVERFTRSATEPEAQQLVNNVAGGNPPTFRQLLGASARDWGFKVKARALYDYVLHQIQGRPAITPNIDAALARFAAETRISPEPAVQQLRDAIDDRLTTQGGLTLADLRTLREDIRNAQDAPSVLQTRNNAQLQQLEHALTSDIYASAGPRRRELQIVDAFYRQGADRIREALAPIARQSQAGAFDTIRRWAREAGGNSDNLLIMKESLRPDEWNTIAASVIEEMGNVTPGAANVLERDAFSLERFVTEYARLSDRGRNILFGAEGGGGAHASQLMKALDDLAYGMGRYKQVRRFENFSRTASSQSWRNTLGQAAGAGAAIFTPLGIFPAVAFVGSQIGMRLMGEALTNPKFVRWLAGASGKGASWRRSLPGLARIVLTDPTLSPVYNELVQYQPQEEQASAPPPASQYRSRALTQAVSGP